jgi:hypothetical protein
VYIYPKLALAALSSAKLSLLDLFLGHVALRGHLAEHGHGVEENLHFVQLKLVIDNGDSNPLNVDGPAVSLDGYLLSLASLAVRENPLCFWTKELTH